MAIRLRLPFKNKGGNSEPELSVDSAQLTQALHGKHYEDCKAGRVFSHTPTPLGLAIPLYTGTGLAGAMPIWNPSNSNVNVELINLNIGKTSGTSNFGAMVLMHRKGMGSGIADGSEITAFAETTPKNGLLGAGNASQVLSSNAGTVTVSAGVAAEAIRSFKGTGVAADTHTGGLQGIDHDFGGSIIVPPGSLVWMACTKASGSLYATTITWKELPIR